MASGERVGPRFSALYYAARAEEARAIAAALTRPAAKRAMLQVAQSYEQLAQAAEIFAKSQPNGFG